MRRAAVWAGLVALALAAPALAQDYDRTLRDWSVACDAVSCQALVTAVPEVAADGGLTLTLQRSAAPGAFVALTVTPERALAEGASVSFEVPGEIADVGGRVQGLTREGGASFALVADAPLLQAMRSGTELVIRVGYGDGAPALWRAPLAGMTDSALVMDMMQNRVGRIDAIIAWGGAPPDSPSDLFPSEGGMDQGPISLGADGSYYDVVYTAAELPEAVAAAGASILECDLAEALPAFGAQVVFEAGPGRTIWMVGCVAGDVNIGHYVVVDDPAAGLDHKLMDFAPWPDGPRDVIVTNPEWAPGEAVLSTLAYGSPGYDCGVFVTYRLEDGGFERTEVREKAECDGEETGPEDYAPVWSR
jgi:hypothetical protein